MAGRRQSLVDTAAEEDLCLDDLAARTVNTSALRKTSPVVSSYSYSTNTCSASTAVTCRSSCTPPFSEDQLGAACVGEGAEVSGLHGSTDTSSC